MEVSVGIYAIVALFFFLVIPGYLFRRFYFHGEFSKQLTFSSNGLINLLVSFFTGIVLLFIVISIWNITTASSINLDRLLSDFDTNLLDDNGQNNFNGFSQKIRSKFLPFIGLLYGMSALFGFAISRMIIYFNLDTKNKVLRFRNDWHYLFSGRNFKFSRVNKTLVNRNDHSKFKYTRLDVLVSEKGEETTLYSGFLLDYDIKPDSNNQLDKIHLIKTQRYSKNKDGRYSPKNIPGNMFTILADRILNINYTFITHDPNEIKIQNFNRRKKRLQGYLILMVVTFLLASIFVLFGIKIESFHWYQREISCKPWYARLILFFGLNIVFGVLTPFKISEKERVIKKLDKDELTGRIVVGAIVIILFFWIW